MINVSKIHIIGYHFGEKLNLDFVKTTLNLEVVKSDSVFLLLKNGSDKFCYIKDYGSIVFAGFDEIEREKVLETLNPRVMPKSEFPEEDFNLVVGQDKSFSLDVNSIFTPTLTVDILHIILFNLGQAVALDFYQLKVNELLEKTREISNQLELSGDVKATRKKLRKFVGKTMGLKNRMAENLYIFETSDLAWSDAELAEIDAKLRKELEVINRHRGIQHGFDIVKENLDLFRDILNHKHSSNLEWIIIVLIAVEIIQLLIERFI